MYSIQNLTNSTIKFQGMTIGAYMTVSVGRIYDYVTLSRLSNSGKIRYFSVPASKKTEEIKKPVDPKVEPEKKTQEEKPVVKLPTKEFGLFQKKADQIKVEEPIKEKKEEIVEETKAEEIVVETKEEPVVETVESSESVEDTPVTDSDVDNNVEEQTSKTTRRGRKSKK